LGPACSKTQLQTDSSSNVISIHFEGSAGTASGGGLVETSMKFVLRSQLELRLQFRVMDFGGGDDCLTARLEIDGVRYCKKKHPQHVILPRRQSNAIEIVWLPLDACFSKHCELSMSIMDSGEPHFFTINSAEFESVTDYHDKTKGITNAMYRYFLFLVCFVWTAYIGNEVAKILYFSRLVLTCPDLAFSRRKRGCIFLGACLPRLVVVTGVFLVGFALFASSPKYLDVVLNTVALAFILDLDEILFNILVPEQLKKILASTEPFEWGGLAQQKPRMLMPVTVSNMLLILIPAIIFWFGQYKWSRGFENIADQLLCACNLQGSQCIDARFGA